MFDAICPAVYKQLRLRTGMTQAQLAVALATSRMTVIRFESGQARPDETQERRLMELARCSDVEFVELVCQELSKRIGRRVLVHEGDDAYQPTTALAAAYTLLEQQATEIPPDETQALQDDIRITQHIAIALEKSNEGLVRRVNDYREQFSRRRERVC